MIDKLQDDDLGKSDCRDLERLKNERLPWESTWNAIDDRFPDGAGGFNQGSPGEIRGRNNFDTTHLTSLFDRIAVVSGTSNVRSVRSGASGRGTMLGNASAGDV